MGNIQDYRQEFIELLQSTGRDGIDYVIEDLDDLGFFSAPASARKHYNYEGGLVEHSLNVYRIAARLRQQMIELRPDLADSLPANSVIITSLLHDACKADIYKKTARKQKNEIGIWESVEAYDVDYSNFPAGHGEKSVIMLLRSGLDMTDDEIMAIRWHMTAWDLPFQSLELKNSLNKARDKYPLCSLIQAADTLAANIIERKSLIND